MVSFRVGADFQQSPDSKVVGDIKFVAAAFIFSIAIDGQRHHFYLLPNQSISNFGVSHRITRRWRVGRDGRLPAC